MNIGKYWSFCEEKFGLRRKLGEIMELRKRPQIPLTTILRCIVDMVPLGQRSLLEVDQCGRSAGFRAWHGSRRRMVASDTTMERVLEKTDLSGIRDLLHDAVRRMDAEEALKVALPSGRKVRACILDGSDFGGHSGCVFSVACAPADLEMHSEGRELDAARRLISRAGRAFGKGFADIVIGDGLYMSRPHIRQCLEDLGSDALIKTGEEKLTVIEDAKGLFSLPAEPGDGVERVEGVDIERGVSYRVTAAGGFRWGALPYELKVARVEEEKLKPGRGEAEREVFWVVTTDGSLSGDDMRALAHLRWAIENNVFKRLSELVGSKRGFLRNGRVKEALLLLWFVGLLMLWWYLGGPGLCLVRETYGAVKVTWRFITRMFYGSIVSACAAGI